MVVPTHRLRGETVGAAPGLLSKSLRLPIQIDIKKNLFI